MRKKLKTIYDVRQSFYGKAETEENGDIITLYSYNTRIADYDRKHHSLLMYEQPKDHTQTTRRHVVEFIKQMRDIYGLNEETEQYVLKYYRIRKRYYYGGV